jgi:hypothetical protein
MSDEVISREEALIRGGHNGPVEMRKAHCHEPFQKEGVGNQGEEHREEQERVARDIPGARCGTQQVVEGRTSAGKSSAKQQNRREERAVNDPVDLEAIKVFGHGPKCDGTSHREDQKQEDLSIPLSSSPAGVNIQEEQRKAVSGEERNREGFQGVQGKRQETHQDARERHDEREPRNSSFPIHEANLFCSLF